MDEDGSSNASEKSPIATSHCTGGWDRNITDSALMLYVVCPFLAHLDLCDIPSPSVWRVDVQKNCEATGVLQHLRCSYLGHLLKICVKSVNTAVTSTDLPAPGVVHGPIHPSPWSPFVLHFGSREPRRVKDWSPQRGLQVVFRTPEGHELVRSELGRCVLPYQEPHPKQNNGFEGPQTLVNSRVRSLLRRVHGSLGLKGSWMALMAWPLGGRHVLHFPTAGPEPQTMTSSGSVCFLCSLSLLNS